MSLFWDGRKMKNFSAEIIHVIRIVIEISFFSSSSPSLSTLYIILLLQIEMTRAWSLALKREIIENSTFSIKSHRDQMKKVRGASPAAHPLARRKYIPPRRTMAHERRRWGKVTVVKAVKVSVEGGQVENIARWRLHKYFSSFQFLVVTFPNTLLDKSLFPFLHFYPAFEYPILFSPVFRRLSRITFPASTFLF